MNKFEILEKYNKEDRILIGKVFDKIKLSEKRNTIEVTDFFNMVEITLIKDVLNKVQFKNFVIFGGVENAQRNCILIYPSKMENFIKENKLDYNNYIKVIRIENYNEKYEHKVYLSGLMKLGISRDKIGDILVQDNGADIIVSDEIANFICYNLGELTRFSKSKIEIISLKDIREKVQEYKDITIRVTSVRLDAIVAELANTSRSKALEIINNERVFVNYKQELKNTRNIQIKDIITIRGIGKFIVFESLGSSRSGKIMLNIKMYV